MLEVECPAVTPEIVLKASGHVERFTDFMVGAAAGGGPGGGEGRVGGAGRWAGASAVAQGCRRE